MNSMWKPLAHLHDIHALYIIENKDIEEFFRPSFNAVYGLACTEIFDRDFSVLYESLDVSRV